MDFLKNIWVISIFSAAIGGIATYTTITMVVSAPSATIENPECLSAKADPEAAVEKPIQRSSRIHNSKGKEY